MPGSTLWECICSLSGDDGMQPIRVAEAVSKSAVTEQVAEVEVRLMIREGLVTSVEGEEVIQLTDRGRRSCADINQTIERMGL